MRNNSSLGAIGAPFPAGLSAGGGSFCHEAAVNKEARLSAEDVRLLLSYDQATGSFTWADGVVSRKVKPGQPAGSYHDGYLRIRIRGCAYRAHRLAWLYVTGAWPRELIDHINGDRADNRFCNLREATLEQNNVNKSVASKRSKTGLMGVYPVGKRFVASAYQGAKCHYLGTFATAEEAFAAYCEKKRELHGSDLSILRADLLSLHAKNFARSAT